MFLLRFCYVFFLYRISCIPIDNDVQGDLKVECDSHIISLQIGTRKPFLGRVFIKNYADFFECYTQGSGRLVAYHQIDIGTCGTTRMRTLNPRGLIVETEIIVSFHPLFVTKIDRSYKIQCVYEESQNQVNNSLEVDHLTTQFYEVNLTMPQCSYMGGPQGFPIRFARIGQPVYHQWSCDTPNRGIFCMFVHSCFADDGNGDRSFLIDGNGCAIDRFLLSDLEYPDDLKAGQETHVFKYADRENIFFQCQISIIVKEPNEECFRPTCNPEGAGGGEIFTTTSPSRNYGIRLIHLMTV
ncbi:unnamed protein product [Caenorhabditis bovis]|uniref:ZP domain-containing protein n=1 Tax=Caenorhabditis bovis TaxID=2654633 RepID=A0A8S1E4M9_9PELO|nr:unnamed protein product [Caenorhabditis bovis]